jgi:hypothetical protein
MPESRSNPALVTKTLVHNAAVAATGASRLTIGSFLDFCSLCDSAVILDELRTIESPDALPQLPLTDMLAAEKILTEFRPVISRDELHRLLLRLPAELSSQLLPAVGDLGSADRRNDRLLGRGGELRGLKYDGTLDQLLSSLNQVVRYPSVGEADKHVALKNRMRRSTGYLVFAAANGLDYYPDFDRVPFAAAIIKDVYQSLPRQVYERVAEALEAVTDTSSDQLVREWTLNATMPIPPATALVLRRSRTCEEIPARLLEVRAEFATYRRYFREFRAELQAADTLKERRRLQQRYRELLEAASGPGHEIVSVTEALNFAEKLVPVAAAPAIPTSYSAGLLTQPADWLRRWWRQRPLAVLFRLDGKLPRLGEYADLMSRLWGEGISSEVIDQYALHSARISRLMTTPAG